MVECKEMERNMKRRNFLGFILLAVAILFSACKGDGDEAKTTFLPSAAEQSRVIYRQDIKNSVIFDDAIDLLQKLGKPVKEDDLGDMGNWVSYYYNWEEEGKQLVVATSHGAISWLSLYNIGKSLSEELPQNIVTGFNSLDYAKTDAPENISFEAMRKDENTVYLICGSRSKEAISSSMDDKIQVAVDMADTLQGATYYVRFVNGDTVTVEYRFKYDEEKLKLYQID